MIHRILHRKQKIDQYEPNSIRQWTHMTRNCKSPAPLVKPVVNVIRIFTDIVFLWISHRNYLLILIFQWVNCTLSTVWFLYFSGSTVHYLQCDLSISVSQLYIIYSVIYLFQRVNCTLSTVWFIYFSGSTVHYIQCDLSISVGQLYIIYSVLYLFQWVNCILSTV